jgi:hypothetical protein
LVKLCKMPEGRRARSEVRRKVKRRAIGAGAELAARAAAILWPGRPGALN